MKHETSTALYHYWLGARNDTGVRAGGVKATELAPLLPDLILVDLDPSLETRIRFCGAAIASRYGRDLSEESFLDLWGPDDREALNRDLRAMSARSTGLVAGVMGETMAGGFVSYEMLLLPLSGEKGGAGALGSMVRVGGHEESNRIRRRIITQWLRSVRFLPAAHPGARRRNDTLLDTLPATPDNRGKRYGHLTVVNGGK